MSGNGEFWVENDGSFWKCVFFDWKLRKNRILRGGECVFCLKIVRKSKCVLELKMFPKSRKLGFLGHAHVGGCLTVYKM